MEARIRQLRVVADLGLRALQGEPVDRIAEAVAEGAALGLGTEFASVLVLDEEQGLLTMAAGYGWPAAIVSEGVVAPLDGPSPAAETVRTAQALIIEDVASDPRTAGARLLTMQGVVSSATVPLRGRERVRGVLSVHSRRRRAFSANDLFFLRSLANMLAVTRERAEAEEAREALQEQLAHAQKLQAVGELAGGVAHDFNNLLTAIVGYTDFALARLDEDHAGRAEVEGIRAAAERGATLTRQLLAIGRRRLVRPQTVDLSELVRRAETLLRRTIGEEIELVTRLDEAVLARADPGEIDQVILNLALNARDAMPNGGTLRLTTEVVELDEEYARAHLDVAAGSFVLLTVDDTGTGMDEATRKRAFEPFFTTKDASRGSGLGLSTIYGIVRQAGGTIWLYSELGLGTSAKVYLPRADAPSPEVEPRRRPPVELRGHETILLVEDDEILRALIEAILSDRGYVVISASRPEQALELFDAHAGEIDLVLSDVVMPGIRGRDMALQLRERAPGLPVVLMSGYAGDTIAFGALARDADFIEKPFSPDALAEKVRTALSRAAS